MKNLKLLVGVIAMSSGAVNATEQITNKYITQVHVYETGASITYKPASTVAPEGCTGAKALNTAHILWSSNDGMKALFTTALTALNSGMQVLIAVSTCTTSGYGAPLPLVYRIDVREDTSIAWDLDED